MTNLVLCFLFSLGVGMDCYTYALRHIARYPKTIHGLRQKLVSKGFDEEEIHDTIQRLKESKLLDDVLYTELYLRSEVCRKWKSLFQVKQKLWQRWVATEIVDDMIESMNKELSYWMLVRLQKLATHETKWKEHFYQKMRQRGYPFDLIQQAFERFDALGSIE